MILDILLAILLVWFFQFLGLVRLLFVICGVTQVFLGNALTAVLLLWVAWEGVKES